tara:strand:- start:187 stop:483 length:297 start_codon:yes stop_codon:yes gene_type:complete
MDDDKKTLMTSRELKDEIIVLFEELIKKDGSGGEQIIRTFDEIFAKISTPENEGSHIDLVMSFGMKVSSVGRLAKRKGVLDTYKSALYREIEMIDLWN